jgi:CRISPR/Cas system CSM-associated protein Csm3 (group 7 of RAMP superfamily)
VEFKYEIDGIMERTKINIYEDRNDEEYLRMIMEFQNYLETFEIWENKNVAWIVYRNFRRCISGATKDLWDQIIASKENEERDELTFTESLGKLTKAVLGVDAFDNQKEYMKETQKPEKMSSSDGSIGSRI